jgi:hypothetical protein
VIFGDATWVSDLMGRIQAKLVADGVLPAERVFPYLGDPLDLLNHPPADKFATIAPVGMPVDSREVAGHGRQTLGFDSRWRIDVTARDGSDREREDRRAFRLIDGLSPLLLQVISSLEQATIHPAPVLGQAPASPLREPMRLIDCTYNPRPAPPGWVWARTIWNLKFRSRFQSGSITVPPPPVGPPFNVLVWSGPDDYLSW